MQNFSILSSICAFRIDFATPYAKVIFLATMSNLEPSETLLERRTKSMWEQRMSLNWLAVLGFENRLKPSLEVVKLDVFNHMLPWGCRGRVDS